MKFAVMSGPVVAEIVDVATPDAAPDGAVPCGDAVRVGWWRTEDSFQPDPPVAAAEALPAPVFVEIGADEALVLDDAETFARIRDQVVLEIMRVPAGRALGDIIHPSIAAECIACPAGTVTGMVWDGETFAAAPIIAPPRVVPETVTLAQARAALMGAGLFETVNAFISNNPNPVLKMAWEYTNNVSRNGAFVTALGPLLGLTDEQLDDLFIAAAAIDF